MFVHSHLDKKLPEAFNSHQKYCRVPYRGVQLPSEILQSSIQRRSTPIRNIAEFHTEAFNSHQKYWRYIYRKDPEFSKQDWENYDCGVFHLRGRAKEAANCAERNLGYICEGKGNKTCVDWRGLEGQCAAIDNRIYIYGCGANNWFDARIKCINNGMDLALLKSKNILLQLYKKWYSRRVICMRVWIGLSKSYWITTRTHGPVRQGSWAPGEPSGKGSCVFSTKGDDHNVYMWYTERCDAVNSWFCSDYKVKSGTTVPSETVKISHVTKTHIPTETPPNIDQTIQTGTWLVAFADCRKKGLHLPAYRLHGDYKYAELWMDTNKISTAWLALNKTRFSTWMWMDDKPFGHTLLMQNWTEFRNCGVLLLRDKGVDVEVCSKGNLGYVCSTKTDKGCKSGLFHPSDCTQYDSRVYTYGYGAANWYDARFRCKKDGMDLAVIRSDSLIRHLHKIWYKDAKMQKTVLWMGLRRNEWKYQETASHSISSWQSFWAFGEPSEMGSCAIISKQTGSEGIKWYAEKCNSEQNWFCIPSEVVTNIQERTTAIIYLTAGIPQKIPSENPTKGPLKRSNALAIALPIIFVVAALTVIGIIVIYRRRLQRKPGQSPVPPDTDEETQLLEIVFQQNDSDITLSFPRAEFSKSDNDILQINARMKQSEYRVNITEKLLTPVVTVVKGLHKHTADGAVNGMEMRQGMKLTIPHKLSIPDCEQYINVYKRNVEDAEWIPLKQGTKETVNHEELVDVQNAYISVVLYHQTTVMCTCKQEGTTPMNLTAVLFYKYYQKSSFQEVNLKLYFVDSLYTIKDCIKTLEDETFSFDLIQVYPSAVKGKSGDARLELDCKVEDDWTIKYQKIGNKQDQLLQLQDLQPTANDPIGLVSGQWIIQNQIEDKKADSLKISLRVTFPEHNEILCQYIERLALQTEDEYTDEES